MTRFPNLFSYFIVRCGIEPLKMPSLKGAPHVTTPLRNKKGKVVQELCRKLVFYKRIIESIVEVIA